MDGALDGPSSPPHPNDLPAPYSNFDGKASPYYKHRLAA
jgi:hypothetical protein